MNYFVFDGKQSTEFGITISGSSTWASTEYDLNSTEIPGKNGDLINEIGRYKNFDFTYESCGIVDHFHTYFPALRSFLLSHANHYYKLEDTYHPDEYLMAAFSGALSPSYDAWNDAGTLDLTFNAMPQRWLKSGDQIVTLTKGSLILNPTHFTAEPVIRVYGTGRLTVGDVNIDISKSYSYPYMDLDSELYDAYFGTENVNKFITSTNYEFPHFEGDSKTTIKFDDTISKIEIKPRWWTL